MAPNRWRSEFERTRLRRSDGWSEIGVDGQRFARPAAKLLDLGCLDLRKRSDASECANDVVSNDIAPAILEGFEKRFFDGAFDFGAGVALRVPGEQLQVEVSGIAASLAEVDSEN